MAKVTVEYDTKTKKMTPCVDGKCMENVHSMSFYNRNLSSYDGKRYKEDEEDTYTCEMGMCQHDKANNMVHRSYIMAGVDTELGKQAIEAGKASKLDAIPDVVFIEVDEDIQSQISQFLKK